MKKDCEHKLICDTCKNLHPTCIQDPNRGNTSVKEEKLFEADNAVSANASIVTNGATRAGAVEGAMVIVPVRVQLRSKPASVTTYAFLDSGSSVSFCTESLAKKLGRDGKAIKLTIGTMGKTHTMHSRIIKGLQISALEGTDVIDMPDVYTKDVMPVSKQHIPTQSEIE